MKMEQINSKTEEHIAIGAPGTAPAWSHQSGGSCRGRARRSISYVAKSKSEQLMK
jgi:hypothetical protein